MSRQYMRFSVSRRLKPWVTLNYFAAAQPTDHPRKQRSMMRDCKFSLSLHTQTQALREVGLQGQQDETLRLTGKNISVWLFPIQ